MASTEIGINRFVVKQILHTNKNMILGFPIYSLYLFPNKTGHLNFKFRERESTHSIHYSLNKEEDTQNSSHFILPQRWAEEPQLSSSWQPLWCASSSVQQSHPLNARTEQTKRCNRAPPGRERTSRSTTERRQPERKKKFTAFCPTQWCIFISLYLFT